MRQRRVHDLAATLGAAYRPRGLFLIGAIDGEWKGCSYVIGTDGAITSVFMKCDNKGIPLCISSEFHRPFPNWRHAFAIGSRRERVLVKEVTRKNVIVPLPEEYRSQVEHLFKDCGTELELPNGRLIQGTLWVPHNRIEFRCKGLLHDPNLVRRILQYMTAIDVRLKFMPVK